MEKLTVEEVKHIGELANLPLSESEVSKFQKQLAETLNFINNLQEVETKNVEPTSQVTGKINEWREDIVAESLSQEEALRNAARRYKGYFVSQIIWE